MDAILGEITLTRRRRKLDEMTKGEGLGDAYTATLSRMNAQPRSRSKLGMQVLMWVSHAERPLHVDELRHALGVEGSIDLDIRNSPAIETLLASSLGLVTVEKSSSTLRLVHYTLQEYLSHNPNLFHKPHSMIAEVCLTYLNFQHVRSFSPALRSAPPTAPFVEYASCSWGTHAKFETTENVKNLALNLLNGYEKHISSKMMLLRGMRAEEQPLDRGDTPKGFTGLHGAAYFGCLEITLALLEVNTSDVQATDFHGNTAISWAARRGHERVVRALLERSDVNIDTPDTRYCRTPLWWAAQNGHEGVVRALLERGGVDPEKTDKWRKTPLYRAVAYGHEGVVMVLLERGGVNPNTADTVFGQTLLSWAAEHGHERVMKILLERNDVNPNKADHCSQTPLSLAANNGHGGVVKMLLERGDISANKVDSLSRTPLSRAAEKGHERVIRVLLEWTIANCDTAVTEYGQTLSWAAANGREGVVRVFLECNCLNPDTPDAKYGRTPLWWASANGHEGIVKMLLQRNDVNPDTPDTEYGQTPLWCAAAKGHVEVVGMLLQRNDINPDTPDTEYGQTPLWCATINGHEEIVRMLLRRNDVNPNTPDTEYDRTHSGVLP